MRPFHPSLLNQQRRIRTSESAQPQNALVVAVDHYGKSVEAGTRGSSAKEAAADAVLALLGEKRENGKVENRRLAVRKLRGGATGGETAFELRVAEIGTDAQGRPVTTCAVDWTADAKPRAAAPDPWPKSARLLREILSDAPGGTTDKETVRAAFYARYPADGTDKQRGDAKRQALARALREAAVAGLLTERETGTGTIIALAGSENDLAALTETGSSGLNEESVTSVTSVTLSRPVTVGERDKRDKCLGEALSVTQRGSVTDPPAGNFVTIEAPAAERPDPLLALYAATLRKQQKPVPVEIETAVRRDARRAGVIPTTPST